MARKIITIAKKELFWYFNTPVGYVLLALFGALVNFLAIRDIFLRQQANIGSLFAFLPWFVMVLAAVVSARSISEESKSGTLEVLMTLPVSVKEIVLGKFLGLGILLLLAVAATLPVPLILYMLGNPGMGIVAGGYIGSVLLVLALLSIGIFISTMSKNQVAAVFTGLVVYFLIMIIGSSIIVDQVPGAVRGLLFFISPVSRFQSISKGVLDLRDLAYFVSIFIGFLYLSIEILKRSK